MKHPFWDRVLILLICVLLVGTGLLLLGMMTRLIPMDFLATTFRTGDALSIGTVDALGRTSRIIISAIGGVLIVLGGLLFLTILPKRKGKHSGYAVQQVEHGTLRISIKAIEHLVQKCISQHPELSCTSMSIVSNEETVRVDLRMTLQSNINIPLAVCALQKQIKQYVEACSGVDVDEVRVVVDGTSPATGEHTSPYEIPEMLQPKLQQRLPTIAAHEPEQTPVAVREEMPLEPMPEPEVAIQLDAAAEEAVPVEEAAPVEEVTPEPQPQPEEVFDITDIEWPGLEPHMSPQEETVQQEQAIETPAHEEEMADEELS